MIKTARIKFEKLLGETPKAFLLKIRGKEHWIPRSQCRDFVLNKKLGGNVILPDFIINRIFDTNINESEDFHDLIEPAWVVITHVPAPVSPMQPAPDESLTR